MGRVKSHSNHQPYKYHNPSSKNFHQSSYQRKSPFAKNPTTRWNGPEEKKSEPKTSTPPFLINEELPTATAAADSARKPSPVMANGFQKTLSKTSLLVNFLPTGTLLTFETLVPTFYRSSSAACNCVTTLMLTALLTLCAFSCFFFHFTDSFRGPDGRVYFGFVTPWGLAAFNPGIEEPKDEKYRLGVADIVHAVMSALVFLAIAFSDHRVSGCLFPGHEKEIDEVMDQGLPLIIGIVCSALFLVFVKDRHGIGCLEAAA